MTMADVSVLIIADDPLARAGVATLLSAQAGYAVVGQVAGDADLAAVIDSSHADVAVWDLGRDPKLSLEHLPDLRDAGLVVVALVPNESYAARALSVGARGLLSREVDSASLLAALTAVTRGFVVIDPALGVAKPRVLDRGGSPLVEDLTPRELEVLQLLAEGLPNRAIAERLHVSEHTAKFHVNAILGKLDAETRTEAVARAARLGLIIF